MHIKVVGLEVHAQVLSNSKLFSGSPTVFGAKPNTQVSLVDAAMPGMLPVINEICVKQAVRTGLGLKATINLHSIFERKNYFYADLPQGYQISQYQHPIVGEGTIVLDMPDGSNRKIGIERLHIEQDAGKSIHDQDQKLSYIDLNRAGVCLMEVVSKPDLRSPEEAGLYVRKLRSIMRYLGTCDGNMEQGSLRADVNVSVRPQGKGDFRTRTEIKNVNSIRFIMQAIELEAGRQVDVWESGGTVIQETRLFDPDKSETRSMRAKEFAHDYRYFPDPDLLPLDLDQAYVDEIALNLPELPDDKKSRFISDYGLSTYDAGILVSERETAEFFERVAIGRDPKQVVNWMTTILFGALNAHGKNITESPITAKQLGALLDLIENDTISSRIAKDVFEEMFSNSKDPQDIIQEKGLTQITDVTAIEAAVNEAIASNPKQAEQVRNGNDRAIGWFVGQVMNSTQGKANPKTVNELLRSRLKD